MRGLQKMIYKPYALLYNKSIAYKTSFIWIQKPHRGGETCLTRAGKYSAQKPHSFSTAKARKTSQVLKILGLTTA
jgi:hypothetical protein